MKFASDTSTSDVLGNPKESRLTRSQYLIKSRAKSRSFCAAFGLLGTTNNKAGKNEIFVYYLFVFIVNDGIRQ